MSVECVTRLLSRSSVCNTNHNLLSPTASDRCVGSPRAEVLRTEELLQPELSFFMEARDGLSDMATERAGSKGSEHQACQLRAPSYASKDESSQRILFAPDS